jgi:hypothetical protein
MLIRGAVVGCLQLALAAAPEYNVPNFTGSLREYLDTADEAFSHIKYAAHLVSEERVMQTWQAAWLDRILCSTSIRTVAEYGIGGGLLGQLLLQNYSVVH